MTNRFTMRAQNALNGALREASSMGHTYIGSEHILLGLLGEKDGIAHKLLIARGVRADKLRSAIIDLSGVGAESRVSPSDMTPRVRKIILDSAAEASRCGQSYVGTEHLLMSILESPDCVAIRLLEAMNVSPEELRRDVTDFLIAAPGSTAGGGFGKNPELSSRSGGRREERARDDARSGQREREKSEDQIPGMPMLSKYGQDLTAKARGEKLDPIIGRENETARLIRILSRRQKNNPCLIGEPGEIGRAHV